MPTPDLAWSLPADLDVPLRDRMEDMRRQEVVRRIWDRDPSVWSGSDEDRWLGWLDLPMQERPSIDRVTRFAADIKAEGLRDIVLLGMGGSSLAPEVIRSIARREEGCPNLHVVDSTDPVQILTVERAVDFQHTLFLVASKSGSTLEVNILKQYFFDRVVERFGEQEAGRRFVLVTDPGSKLHLIAQRERFRAIFEGVPTVGGRYSALSNFGLVPAALIGVDVATLLERAGHMSRLCASDGPDSSAFELGVGLGELALRGRDKPTLVAPTNLAPFGAWMEQLVAESLGKEGKGIIPIDGEPPGPPDTYGRDRVFVQLRLTGAPDAAADAMVERLEHSGHPIVRIDWPDRDALGAEFFRWEFATAVAGAVLGVNPFDQPDVEATKVVTRRLAAEYESTGKLPDDEPLARGQGLSVFADPENRRRLGTHETPAQYVKSLVSQLQDGDYFALLAFIEMNQPHRDELESIRRLVRNRRKVATTAGFGPRYLHSTGQAHKGGPDSGVFLLITCDDSEDMAVPGQKYRFSAIKLAQALGDFEVLGARGRRLLRVHLHDVDAGLRELHTILQQAV